MYREVQAAFNGTQDGQECRIAVSVTRMRWYK